MPGVRDLIAQVEEERIRESLFWLSKDPLPRRTMNFTLPGHGLSTLEEADAWIADRLRGWGYAVQDLACRVQAFRCNPRKPLHHWYDLALPEDPFYTAHNVIAEKRGARLPEERIVLMAHKDSQSWIECPGANDNAIGTAAVLELARVLARHPTDRTVRFIFCNEEHMPWTSEAAAAESRRRGENLIAIFNVDSIGGRSDEDRARGRMTNATLYTTPEGKVLADLMAEVNAEYGIGLEQSAVLRESPGDDDGSFIKAGFPAAVANLGSYPYADPQYHLPGDAPERTDTLNARMTAQAVLAAVLTLDSQ